MLRRFFGSEKIPQEAVVDPSMNNLGSGVTETTSRVILKAEDNKLLEGLNITQSLPDLTISTTTGSAVERLQEEQGGQKVRINYPKDSLDSINESLCSDPMADQLQNKQENMYRSAENLLAVEKSRGVQSARRVFSLKKSSHRQKQFDELSRNSQSSSNSASLLSVDSNVSDVLKSEVKQTEVQKNKGATREKSGTFGSRTFKELLFSDGGSNPDKSGEFVNGKSSKSSSRSRERSRTLIGSEFSMPSEISKSPVPEADGVQSDRENQGPVTSERTSGRRSTSVKGARTSKYSDVTGTPSKADSLSARAAIVNVPISKLDDHLVLALDGLEEDSEVQVAKVDASSLSFKPEKLATYLEDTWNINKALINLDCIAILLPSSRHSSYGLANLLPQLESVVKKLCIAKGSVAMSRIQGTWSYSRYLFLSSENLLIMKQKTATTFKLKKKVTISNLWLAPNHENSGEVGNGGGLPLSIIIGWPPATNYLFLFTKAEQKMMWMTLLEKQISAERQKEVQKENVIKIATQDTNCAMAKSFVVKPEETVFQVVQRCLKELHLVDGDPKHFELCIQSRDNIIPLAGYEMPFYIQNSREQGHQQDYRDKTSPQNRLTLAFDHFVLRPKKTPQKNGFRKHVRNRRLTLVGLFGKKSASPQPDVLQSMPQPKLFGRGLSEVCTDNSLPKPILDMLQCLYIHGPVTPGIFRKSGNHRDLLELKARLDAGEECNMNGISIHVAASAVKNWLRSLPDCLLLSRLYSQWIKVMGIADGEKKSSSMKRLVMQLPNHNILLLRYLVCVLRHVCSRAEHNSMNSSNLAICLGPTVLWPEGVVDLTSECVSVQLVARVTQLLIDDAEQILGEDSLELFKGSSEEVHVEPELNFESEDSMGSHEVLNANGDLEKGTSLESLDNNSFDDGLDNHSYSAVESQMSMDSGLAVSNPRLNEEPEPPAIVFHIPPDQPRYTKRHPGTKKKVHVKSELSNISEALTTQDSEDRPKSKMAGAGNVRQRISRLQASKAHTDDSFSCEENFDSSDDEFMLTSISSSENFAVDNSYFKDGNSVNVETSREFEDISASGEIKRNDGLMVSEIIKRAVPAPVTIERQMSGWPSQKADVSVKNSQTELDKPAPALDQNSPKDLSESGNDWYFMGPEEKVQTNSNILKSSPDKLKSKSEILSKTSVAEVQDRKDEFSQNHYRLSSNSLRCERSGINESSVQPVKQNSFDSTFAHNSVTVSLTEVKPTAKSQPARSAFGTSDSNPVRFRLASSEVLEKQSSRQIHPSEDCEAQLSANRISVSSENLNSETLHHRSGRNRSVPRRLTDVAVNTSDSLFRRSRGVQTDPMHDQNISRPMNKPRCSSLILTGDEMEDSKHEIDCTRYKNQEENLPVLKSGRRFKSDLGLSSRRSWREEFAENYSQEALRAFSSQLQSCQTEKRADKDQVHALDRTMNANEQVQSKESDQYTSHHQVRRSSAHKVTSPGESGDFFYEFPVMDNTAPVSFGQRIRDQRAIRVASIGSGDSKPRSCENKPAAHQSTAICIPTKEFATSHTGKQYSDDRGNKTFISDSELPQSNIVGILSKAFNQTSNSCSGQNYVPSSLRTLPTHTVNTPSAKLNNLSNSAVINHSSVQVQSSVPAHDHKDRVGSQNLVASRKIASSTNQLYTPQQSSKFPHNSSVKSTNGEIIHRGSLKGREEGRWGTSQSIDSALRVTLHSVENSQKDVLIRNDSQRHSDAKGPRSPIKPIVASHEFDIRKMVEVHGNDSRSNSLPAKAEDSSITWSVNELRKRFDMALLNDRFTQQKPIVKKQ